MRTLSAETIHARAVTLGRERGFPAEAGRLAAINPDRHVNKLLERVKQEAWDSLSDNDIIAGLVQCLWLDWVTVECRAIEARGAVSSGQA